MNISSHCTIGKHAYGTCLNGYAHFSSLFLCAINVEFLAIRKANYEKCNIYPVSMFCYIKLHSWGQKLLLCKHDECEHKKRLNSYTQYKISTAFCDFIPKCRSWRIVDTVKDIKKKRKNIKIKTTNTNRKQQQQKNKYYCQAGIRTTIACVESEDHSHWSIVSYG